MSPVFSAATTMAMPSCVVPIPPEFSSITAAIRAGWEAERRLRPMAAQDSRIAGLLREWNRAEFGLEVLYFETTGGTQFVVEVLNGNDALIERAFVGRFSADDPTRAEVVCLAARLQAWVRGTSRSKQWSLQERSTYGWVLIGGVGAWSIYHVVRGTPQSSLRGQSILAVGATLVGMYLLR